MSHQSVPKKNITRFKFSKEEDEKINELVKKFGQNWNMIQSHFGPTRTKRQLRERWINYLNPNYTIKFTNDEDLYLLKLYSLYGPKWSFIAKTIGNKSSVCCRNRFGSLKSKSKLLFESKSFSKTMVYQNHNLDIKNKNSTNFEDKTSLSMPNNSTSSNTNIIYDNNIEIYKSDTSEWDLEDEDYLNDFQNDSSTNIFYENL